MPSDVAGKAADIVDEDNILAAAPVFLEIGEHGEHTGAVDHAAGYGLVLEMRDNLIALHPRELFAARALGGVAMALGDLRGGGDAAVDHCFHSGRRTGHV